MIKKKVRNGFNAVKGFFTPLESKQVDSHYLSVGPVLEPYSTERLKSHISYYRGFHDEIIPSDDEADKINRDRLEQAKLSQAYDQMAQSREALNLTLKSQQRLLIATLVTATVALVVGIISLFNSPPVVNVQLPGRDERTPIIDSRPPTLYN